MTKKELKGKLHAQLMQAVNELIREGTVNEELKTGGVTAFGPNYLKVKMVDADYRPHSFTICIQEDQQ